MLTGQIHSSRSGAFHRRADNAAVNETRTGFGHDFADLLGCSSRDRIGINIDSFEAMLGDIAGEVESGIGWADRENDIAFIDRVD